MPADTPGRILPITGLDRKSDLVFDKTAEAVFERSAELGGVTTVVKVGGAMEDRCKR